MRPTPKTYREALIPGSRITRELSGQFLLQIAIEEKMGELSKEQANQYRRVLETRVECT